MLASLQEAKKHAKKPKQSVNANQNINDVETSNNATDNPNTQNVIKESDSNLTKTLSVIAHAARKTHIPVAQRKFSQSFNFPSPVTTSVNVKDINPDKVPELFAKCRPKTEDFLTFLCLRNTSILPPSLDFISLNSISKTRTEKFGDEVLPLKQEVKNNKTENKNCGEGEKLKDEMVKKCSTAKQEVICKGNNKTTFEKTKSLKKENLSSNLRSSSVKGISLRISEVSFKKPNLRKSTKINNTTTNITTNSKSQAVKTLKEKYQNQRLKKRNVQNTTTKKNVQDTIRFDKHRLRQSKRKTIAHLGSSLEKEYVIEFPRKGSKRKAEEVSTRQLRSNKNIFQEKKQPLVKKNFTESNSSEKRSHQKLKTFQMNPVSRLNTPKDHGHKNIKNDVTQKQKRLLKTNKSTNSNVIQKKSLRSETVHFAKSKLLKTSTAVDVKKKCGRPKSIKNLKPVVTKPVTRSDKRKQLGGKNTENTINEKVKIEKRHLRCNQSHKYFDFSSKSKRKAKTASKNLGRVKDLVSNGKKVQKIVLDHSNKNTAKKRILRNALKNINLRRSK